MFNPLHFLTPLVDPECWAYLGREALIASPMLISAYGLILNYLNTAHHRHTASAAKLHQLLALDLTIMAFAVFVRVRQRLSS